MILGIGTDVVGLDRFAVVIGRTPSVRDRLFTPAEAGSPVAELAARFAAKEAMVKALGAPHGLSWKECEVVTGEPEGPTYVLTGGLADRAAALGVRRWHLALDSGPRVVTAFCVLED